MMMKPQMVAIKLQTVLLGGKEGNERTWLLHFFRSTVFSHKYLNSLPYEDNLVVVFAWDKFRYIVKAINI